MTGSQALPLTDEPRAGARPLVAAGVLVALLLPVVAAHAQLEASVPAANAAVAEPVTAVALTFTEGVEAAFSTFKVYRIDGTVDLTADDAAMRLNALAAVLVTSYAGSQGDGAGKVEAELAPAADEAVVTLTFAEPLEPGHYVVMWRLLSADTHVVDGHLVFTVVGR